MSLSRRVARAEAQAQRAMIQQIAAEYGMSPDELLEEVETLFRLPLAEQLAEVDRIQRELQAEAMTMDDWDDIKATLLREYRP